MSKKLFIVLLSFCPAMLFAQDQIMKDLDGDLVTDTVYIDQQTSQIICVLSSQHFEKILSGEIELLNETSGLSPTKNGFEFWNNWMRAGYSNQFRYDAQTKAMQLIGMSRYDFGNAANDGSGHSSVNLLTNQYIGDWNYFDEKKQELIKIPTIKATLYFPKIYLEAFSDKVYFDYADKCDKLFHDKIGQ